MGPGSVRLGAPGLRMTSLWQALVGVSSLCTGHMNSALLLFEPANWKVSAVSLGPEQRNSQVMELLEAAVT